MYFSAMALLSFMFVAVGTSAPDGKHLYAAGVWGISYDSLVQDMAVAPPPPPPPPRHQAVCVFECDGGRWCIVVYP